jgi:hypothetical protein
MGFTYRAMFELSGMNAGLEGCRTGMVVTLLMLGAGVFLGWMVPWLTGGAGGL